MVQQPPGLEKVPGVPVHAEGRLSESEIVQIWIHKVCLAGGVQRMKEQSQT